MICYLIEPKSSYFPTMLEPLSLYSIPYGTLMPVALGRGVDLCMGSPSDFTPADYTTYNRVNSSGLPKTYFPSFPAINLSIQLAGLTR